jgi:hypothetical protein
LKNKFIEGKNYFFAIPLQEIKIEEINVKTPVKFAFCSIYFPKSYQDIEDYIYLIKVFDYFRNEINIIPDSIDKKNLLFGESRMLPFIPTNGEMKWIKIGEMKNKREYNDFPDFKVSNLQSNLEPSKRKWRIMKKCGFKETPEIAEYEKIKNLEYSDEQAEIGIKFRIYVHLIKEILKKSNYELTLNQWKEIIFDILQNEPALKKISKSDIKNVLIENYIYDYTGIFPLS